MVDVSRLIINVMETMIVMITVMKKTVAANHKVNSNSYLLHNYYEEYK